MTDFPEQLDMGTFLNSYLSKYLKDQIHTMIPGEIVSYDHSKRQCKVKPVINIHTEQGIIEFPVLTSVKVQFPFGGGYGISFELIAGDTGGIFFSESSLAEWIKQGGITTPKSKRSHHVSDAIFIPGVIPDAALPSFTHSGDGISISNSAGTRKIVLNSAGVDVLGDLSVTGNISATGDVVAGLISLKNHTHSVNTTISNATPAGPGPVVGTGSTGTPL